MQSIRARFKRQLAKLIQFSLKEVASVFVLSTGVGLSIAHACQSRLKLGDDRRLSSGCFAIILGIKLGELSVPNSLHVDLL